MTGDENTVTDKDNLTIFLPKFVMRLDVLSFIVIIILKGSRFLKSNG